MGAVAKRRSALPQEPLKYQSLELAYVAMRQRYPETIVTLVPERSVGGKFWGEIMPEMCFGYTRESVIEELGAEQGIEVSPLEVRVQRKIEIGPFNFPPHYNTYLVLLEPRKPLRLLKRA